MVVRRVFHLGFHSSSGSRRQTRIGSSIRRRRASIHSSHNVRHLLGRRARVNGSRGSHVGRGRHVVRRRRDLVHDVSHGSRVQTGVGSGSCSRGSSVHRFGHVRSLRCSRSVVECGGGSDVSRVRHLFGRLNHFADDVGHGGRLETGFGGGKRSRVAVVHGGRDFQRLA
ncbi:hypothetical protein H257_09652 [Aphanomyces astaci]|uniref:Uncharacterized protein n=1 Tax=Aphanomyces astaci TaxID=112090 RepID=W4GB05_APHAT|nr:hypothetical protein H257_09652 [Aphanomyces astaci]ETV76118.1 hypothetical protein H257_09652 [Aphanomyces astaci]|eukprot:XP_009834243.1 hypothetical protein H257_09652 [Aphanomyces astaci]